ncbi:magnesium-translocating P-type ATPase [Gilliamella sp. Imp1-1]|uniref:magnesium-translocating P-type ATPase n=1 Tax=Gilliamella sp. Imp1-1 TaxID=3120248 RepID=UPI000460F132|nr:magnesium-translocating P-type ATPase [Gilliamella apicola]KDN09567.1 Mg(2+) transport ATPase, P-type [Gilliamella apicola]OCG57189.1 magnesium-translocating P-type ATPase [Gilliamella apicola]
MTKNTSKTKAQNSVDIKAINEAQSSLDSILAKFQSSLSGLTQESAKSRIETYGKNEVAREKVPSVLIQLLMAFNNPFIFVLLALAIVSFVTDFWLPLQNGEETDLTSIIIILTMVSLSGLLRFWQEFRSNKAAEALKSMIRTTATVLRRAHKDMTPERIEIPLSEIVPGDIVYLSAGDMIPADIRLIESRDLFVSQAVLTGESIPVEKYDTLGAVTQKTSDNIETSNINKDNLLDVNNICYMGTNVVSGTATAIVVATGGDTHFGSLAKSIVGSRAETSFDRGVNSVSWLLIRFMLIMVPIVFFINGFSKNDWGDAALFALAVAVGLTPEMLPMIVSANLAKGAVGMAKRKVVVKRLNAIQNFGAMDILCTDKTGTLTQDKIILEHHLDIKGQVDSSVLELAWLNSYYQSGMKNLMDKAIIRFAEEKTSMKKVGVSLYKKIDELPFDFVRRRLSVVVQNGDDNHLMICKGAVEEMLSIASYVYENDEYLPLNDERKQALIALAHEYNKEGFRVLAVGVKNIPASETKPQYTVQDETALAIRGFLTFLDPPKESAFEAISALNEHGVGVKVLTGDNEIITIKVCREVGLEPGTPLLGTEIEKMDDVELKKQIEQHTIFAKLTPLQKSRIIRLLQDNGHTVGFLGDGINDAPALRDADVGISVDTATDIAKESADIILLEKSLMVLEEGVICGRETFGNIMKYLNMTASSNFGNIFSVLVASAFLPFLPMLAIHLLIQNLLYDISQLSLPWDKMDNEFLQKPRKWNALNIRRFMIWIGPTSSIFDITTYALMWFVFSANSVEAQSLFHSGWFIEGLLSQTLVVHMLRTQKIPFVQSTAAFPVIVMTLLVMAIGIYIPFSPLSGLIGLQPLPWSYFPWLLATLFSYCCVAQLMKRIYIKRFGQWF